MNTHLAVATHALTRLAAENGPLSSKRLADSVGTNPVFLRRVLRGLRNAGVIETQRGAGGGTALARPASDITLRDVYRAVTADSELLKIHSEPNPACRIGANVQGVLEARFADAEQALQDTLARTSIADVLDAVLDRATR